MRLFAAITAGSAVSIPNAATSPGVWCRMIACQCLPALLLVPGDSCRVRVVDMEGFESGAAVRIAEKSASIKSGRGAGLLALPGTVGEDVRLPADPEVAGAM